MQFPLNLLLAATSVSTASHFHSFVIAFSSSELLLRRCNIGRRQVLFHRTESTTRLRYKYQEPSDVSGSDFGNHDDSSSSSNSGGGDQVNVWSVLATTERWISDTLDRSNQAEVLRQQQQEQQRQNKKGPAHSSNMHFADEKVESQNQQAPGGGGKDNPYARKEVSYVCETGSDLAVVVGGVFCRVREAWELGKRHGRVVELGLLGEGDSPTQSTTMRQTNVIVIPNCEELAKFQTFDALVQAVNQARRAARDFVLKKKDGEDIGIKDWV